MQKTWVLTAALILTACQTTSEVVWGINSGVHNFTDEHTCFIAPKHLVHSSRGTSSVGFFTGELVPYAKFVEGSVEAGVMFDRSYVGQAVGQIEMRVDKGSILKLDPIAAHKNDQLEQLSNQPYGQMMKSAMEQSQQMMLSAMAKKAGFTGEKGTALVKAWLQGERIRYRQVSVIGESSTGEFLLSGFKEQFLKCSDKALGEELTRVKKGQREI